MSKPKTSIVGGSDKTYTMGEYGKNRGLKAQDYQLLSNAQPKTIMRKDRAALYSTTVLSEQNTPKSNLRLEKWDGVEVMSSGITYTDSQMIYYPSRKELMESNIPYCTRCCYYGHRIPECTIPYTPNSSPSQSLSRTGIPYCNACSRSGHKTEDCFSLHTNIRAERKNIVSLRFQRPTVAKYKVRDFIKSVQGYSYKAQIYNQPSRQCKVISTISAGGIINACDTSFCGIRERWLTTYIETGEVGYTCIADGNNVYLELAQVD
jgi:hypothetical protein